MIFEKYNNLDQVSYRIILSHPFLKFLFLTLIFRVSSWERVGQLAIEQRRDDYFPPARKTCNPAPAVLFLPHLEQSVGHDGVDAVHFLTVIVA